MGTDSLLFISLVALQAAVYLLTFFVAARNDCFPWPVATKNFPGLVRFLRDYIAAVFFSVINFNLFFASGIFNAPASSFAYKPDLTNILFALCLSILPTFFLFAFHQLILFSDHDVLDSQRSKTICRYFFSLMIFMTLLIIGLPLIQTLLEALGINTISWQLSSELLRLSLPFSLIPMAFAGVLMIVCGSKRSKLLGSEILTPLSKIADLERIRRRRSRIAKTGDKGENLNASRRNFVILRGRGRKRANGDDEHYL